MYAIHLSSPMTPPPNPRRRTPLNKARVLQAAIALADEDELDAFSMRRLAQELGVVPMALYKHVANKEELLDGMVDIVFGEIESPAVDGDWRRPADCSHAQRGILAGSSCRGARRGFRRGTAQ